jgi:hypothetical protein
MVRFFLKIYNKLRFIYAYLKSSITGILYVQQFRSIKKFVLFIGYPRSGHSIIASLLDAHPDIIMGMEWGVLSHLKLGYKRLQIFSSIKRNSELFRKRNDNTWTGYSYKVNGLWQGDFREIKIIGDKLGGQTSLMLSECPEMLKKLERVVRNPVIFIHVIRNPYDTITTMVTRSFEKKNISRIPESLDLLPFIHGYFSRVDLISTMKKNESLHMIDVYHEDFIKNPRQILVELLTYLEVEIFEEYIEKCSSIVYKEPHKSRLTIEWPEELIKFVQGNINRYEFLKRYTFNSK